MSLLSISIRTPWKSCLQDTVEILFGQQRARGQEDAVTTLHAVKQFLLNNQAIMLQKSLALGGSSNISSRKRRNLLTPLHSVDLWQSIGVREL